MRARPLLRNKLNALIAALILLLAPLLRYAYLDYRAWYSLGPGGVPHNILGWLLQNAMRLISRETLDTAIYDDPRVISQAGEYGNYTFLDAEDIPPRDPPRPDVGKWVVPQRQRNQLPTIEMKEVIWIRSFMSSEERLIGDKPRIADSANNAPIQNIRKHIASLAAASPDVLLSAPSKLELNADALFLASAFTTSAKPIYPHVAARKAKGEIAHMHESDGSLHVTLAPKDAKLVVERGWGQRHSLSGGVLPAGYTMVYGPRNEEEKTVAEKIVGAGVRFMCAEPGTRN